MILRDRAVGRARWADGEKFKGASVSEFKKTLETKGIDSSKGYIDDSESEPAATA